MEFLQNLGQQTSVISGLIICLGIMWVLAVSVYSKIVKKPIKFFRRAEILYNKVTELEKFKHSQLEKNKESEILYKTVLDRLHKMDVLRIRARITDFANDLRIGEKKSDVKFKNIHDEYDYYKGLGENSYIDSQMRIIEQYEKKEM